MDVVIGFVTGALTVLLANKMMVWDREEKEKPKHNEDLDENELDKD